MKKLFLIAILIAMASVSFAQITTLTVDTAIEVTGCTSNPSYTAYNKATGHYLVCDYGDTGANKVRIANGTTGALLGTALNITGLNLGTLGVFAIAAGPDGVIYGQTNASTAGVADLNSLMRWANESAVPTQQDPAAHSDTTPVEFARTMSVIGTGLDTKVAAAGDSTIYIVTICTTIDGTTFAVTDHTPTPSLGNNVFKQGIALAANGNIIVGTKADGAGFISKLVKTGGVWGEVAGYVPLDAYDATVGGASPVGYSAGHDAIFTLGYSNIAGAEILAVISGSTGALVTSAVVPTINVGTYGYGSIFIDETAGKGYFGARSATAGAFVVGSFSFTPYVPPVTPSPSPAPSPTPEGNFAVSTSWGLYE